MKEHQQSGNWPANARADLLKMRFDLTDNGYPEADFVFVAHNKIIRHLLASSPYEGYTYRNWFIREDVVYSIIVDNSLKETEGYLYATNKGMPFIKHLEGVWIIPHDSVYKYKFIQDVIVEREQ